MHIIRTAPMPKSRVPVPRVPVPRGLTLNEQDINYKHTAQHTDKHTENTKKNEIWKKTTTIFIQMDTNTMTNTRKIQKHMKWKKTTTIFRQMDNYNYKHTENTETNGIRKKDDNNFFYIQMDKSTITNTRKIQTIKGNTKSKECQSKCM